MFDFDTLDNLLAAHRPWWQPAPFRDPVVPWLETSKDLADALGALSDEDYRALRADDTQARAWLAHWIPDIRALDAFREPEAPGMAADFKEPPHVPGRKARQVSNFCDGVAPASGRLVEWCAGQGWLLEEALRRQPDRTGLGLEWQQRLCDQGEKRLRDHGLDARIQHCDVMDDDGLPQLHSADTVMALHACGHLHQQLIIKATQLGAHTLHISPCCYHLGTTGPMSRLGQQARLAATEVDRHLAVQDITTGHSNRSKRNEKASSWRLGYDALRRQLTGDTGYRPLKSMPGSVWQGSFEGFCQLAADHHQITLPGNADWAHWLATGQQQHKRIRRLELPRRQYRRLLEWWLVLDSAQALREQGFNVSTGLFCSGDLTPRNLLISAQRNTP